MKDDSKTNMNIFWSQNMCVLSTFQSFFKQTFVHIKEISKKALELDLSKIFPLNNAKAPILRSWKINFILYNKFKLFIFL